MKRKGVPGWLSLGHETLDLGSREFKPHAGHKAYLNKRNKKAQEEGMNYARGPGDKRDRPESNLEGKRDRTWGLLKG